ncbi:HET-domain-containing protein [Ophiobolus disseminans]|uniref:HET-domain-containing protein n=1 Tax=Ophiobolus disseminans TaxID=1469910 RepID=A0A6A6ZTG1_9PLEO|nr:HET-domain-containing protein [Ophiobolus disseminans]
MHGDLKPENLLWFLPKREDDRSWAARRRDWWEKQREKKEAKTHSVVPTSYHNPMKDDMDIDAPYRHGDVKPQNILSFTPGEGGDRIGILKARDWEEAKIPNVIPESHEFSPQEVRGGQIGILKIGGWGEVPHRKFIPTRSGTGRYKPPEVEGPFLSRMWDIWAYGCITLEFIIWLLYGDFELARFNNSFRGERFFQAVEQNGRKTTSVHRVVEDWINHLSKDGACQVGSTALGDLLEIVRKGLLVVNVHPRGVTSLSTNMPTLHLHPQQAETSQDPQSLHIPTISITDFSPPEDIDHETHDAAPVRFRAYEVVNRLEKILQTSETDIRRYWSPEKIARHGPYVVEETSSLDAIKPARDDYDPTMSTKANLRAWKYEVDNAFAYELYSALKDTKKFPMPNIIISVNLCETCTKLRDNIWGPGLPNFDLSYDVQGLRNRASERVCDLCVLLWRSCEKGDTMTEYLQLERIGSFLSMNGYRVPALAICRDIDYDTMESKEIQIGSVQLPHAGSAAHFEILQRWLDSCDSETVSCRPASAARMPTRLVDVGQAGDDNVHLREMTSQDVGEWLLLSHQWGAQAAYRSFVTNTANFRSYTAGIALSTLPATFNDAVLVTRALGYRYLWIDALCIVQDSQDDWKVEASHMEDYISGASCVIAAVCPKDSFSGFLNTRKYREGVTFHRQDSAAPVHICEMIDDFQGHVLDSDLCQRGWLLQEHALARRTMFFTEYQTYWECGHGIRCETMTRLSNENERLLGDPNFPSIIGYKTGDDKIELYQGLYATYSRLAFVQVVDRSVAIAGLQKRLTETLKVQGNFGILEDAENRELLARSLLWHRGLDTPRLNRIDFSNRNINIPSWSWMAYTGGINYLGVNSEDVDWKDVQSPWSRTGAETAAISLRAKACQYDLSASPESKNTLIFDDSGESLPMRKLCVVIGVERGDGSLQSGRHYVLLIVPDGDAVYQRVGVGYMDGKCLAEESVEVTIC